MADTTRTFIAVAVPEALSPRLARLRQNMTGEVPSARWVETAPHHVTLGFLGDVAHADLSDVCRVTADAAATFAPFELTLNGLGAFPDPARPRVIWAGVGCEGVEDLRALQAILAKVVGAVGYPGDSRPFRPHVTLAFIDADKGRKGPRVPPPDLTTTLDRRKNWSAGPFLVNEATVFASTLTREGPSYDRIGRAPLRRGKPAGNLDLHGSGAVV